MRSDRLLRLADLLERDAAEPNGIQFDLAAWARPDKDGNYKVACGTAACAIGLACISGEFAEEGLTFTIFGSAFCPVYEGRDHFNAVASFFEIGICSCWTLFDASSYNKGNLIGAVAELAVAQRVREFVNNHEVAS